MSLLQMSFAGTVIILAVTIIRAAGMNKLPKTAFLVLWGVALVRLLIPYTVPSALSVYSLWERLASPIHTPNTMPAAIPASPVTSIAPATPGAVVPAALAVSPSAVQIDPWMVIWAIGVAACGLFFAVSYFRCRREFKTSLPVDNDVSRAWLKAHQLKRPITIRYSDRISAPLTYGVFHPVILMPKTADWSDGNSVKYILAHEYVHICRFDAVTKLVLTAALCVHWFNPAVWLMYVLANRDIELSCDESVIHLFGERTKAEYAMTLIHMEEIRSGLTPLCNNFSKNAIEERIVAIMKMKKTSMAALLVALALVVCVTTGFATSAQATSSKTADEKTTDTFPPVGSQQDNPEKTTMEPTRIISYVDSFDGKTYFTADNGETWQVGDPIHEAYAYKDVDWWTAEEYEAWMKEQEKEYQSIIGERCWNPTKGWYTWDQSCVDEAVAGNLQLLEEIKSGKLVSKPMADGDAMLMFSYDARAIETTTDVTVGGGSFAGFDAQGQIPNGRAASRENLEAYKAFGLMYDEAKQIFTWKGKLVRYFSDEYETAGGIATIYSYANENGVVDLYTVRQATQNTDGSIDPAGKLVDIKECSQEEFDNRVIMPPETAQESVAFGVVATAGGTTFTDRFAKYRDFGITYEEAKNASGKGNVYLNGQLVNRFADVTPDGSAFSFDSADQGGINVKTVYDSNGKLVGVEPVKE